MALRGDSTLQQLQELVEEQQGEGFCLRSVLLQPPGGAVHGSPARGGR